MANYQTVEESWARHKDFEFDTEEEGKYQRGHFGFTRVKALLERVPEGSLVLEMGCNSGGLSKILMTERYCFCHGVDVAPHMIARAKKKGLLAKVAPAEMTDYEDGKFDVVLASELLEHVFDSDVVLQEAVRVLRDGGKFVGSVPTPTSFTNKKRPLDRHQYHCRVFSEKILRRDLGRYFKEVEVCGVPFNPEPVNGGWINKHAIGMIKRRTPQWFVFSGVKS